MYVRRVDLVIEVALIFADRIAYLFILDLPRTRTGLSSHVARDTLLALPHTCDTLTHPIPQHFNLTRNFVLSKFTYLLRLDHCLYEPLTHYLPPNHKSSYQMY